ncbi:MULTISPECIES: helix-turn-helix domain-containing protein [Sphingobium]|uniref:AraC-like DNA-binding protein n=1 Tax=Sphingobium lignivorans TaxID=2735886 RepID=A0ABR6NGR9_9SPHN|nr:MULTISPECIES: helix-turn-helix domain-containing protein [Sphingobium]MBB5986478.1 AraC-like DNA-binding protein [Sphingobium lignivorans]BAK67235.1 AraC family transcriptional regulator [Sphingobium sp. SYK-6]
MGTVNLEGLSSVVDLSGVEGERRADIWTGAAPAIFPGLRIDTIEPHPSIGSIQHSRMGQGALFAITSAPAEVAYVPRAVNETGQHLTLMLQTDGSMVAFQRQRHCELGPGDICFIDERQPFRLIGTGCSQFMLLRMPRMLALNRFPELEHLVATIISCRDPGTQLLAQTLIHLLHVANELREAQQNAAMNAIIHMLGATSGLACDLETVHWRVQKALDFIEMNLPSPDLSAEQVARAQHISRRRLDQLMRDALGLSITGQIWNRRLQRAADDLRDPRWANAPISQIAFANGFEDPAHFARAFKRRFEETPGQWRARVRIPH